MQIATTLSFPERIDLVLTKINGHLRFYRRPDHLGSDENAMAFARMTAEVMNKNLSAKLGSEALAANIDAALLRLMENYRGREWPTPADFVRAMKSAPKSDRAASTPDVTIQSAPLAARRIRAGAPVGEFWIYGRGAIELLRDHGVVEHDLQPYRDGMFERDAETLGHEAAVQIRSKREEKHRFALDTYEA